MDNANTRRDIATAYGDPTRAARKEEEEDEGNEQPDALPQECT